MAGSPGFSLIGQLASLAIVSVLFAVAVPSYMDMMPRVRLQGATRQLVSDLMFARMKAVRERNRHRLVFLDGQSYQVLADNGDGERIAVLTRSLAVDYRGVELAANRSPVFNAGGRASTLATITLRNEAGEKRLSVNITGRVKVQ